MTGPKCGQLWVSGRSLRKCTIREKHRATEVWRRPVKPLKLDTYGGIIRLFSSMLCVDIDAHFLRQSADWTQNRIICKLNIFKGLCDSKNT